MLSVTKHLELCLNCINLNKCLLYHYYLAWVYWMQAWCQALSNLLGWKTLSLSSWECTVMLESQCVMSWCVSCCGWCRAFRPSGRSQELQCIWNGYRGLQILPAKLPRGLQVVLTCRGGRGKVWGVCSALAGPGINRAAQSGGTQHESGAKVRCSLCSQFRSSDSWSMVTRELLEALCPESCGHLQCRMFFLEIIRGNKG